MPANAPDPQRLLARWIRQARRAGVQEPEAMALATADRAGRPSVRMVLLRALDDRGLVFFTNYQSRKGGDLARNPYAAATFYWAATDRQVRVEGDVTRLSPKESDRYFASRPRGAQLAAWASPQSRVLQDRATLLRRYRDVTRRFRGHEVPRPPHWGGVLIRPRCVEFWVARSRRLHDRLRCERTARGWRMLRLAP